MRQNGMSGKLLKLLQTYLSNRKQRVVLNGFSSDYSRIESGVPQGSVLGPLLFFIYINDLEQNIKSNVNFFADDTMLFSVVNNPSISASELNQDLKGISQWAYQWKMEFNPDLNKQATEPLFSSKKTSPNHPSLFFNESIVPKVNEQKYLGLILDSKVNEQNHLGLILDSKVNEQKHLGLILDSKVNEQKHLGLIFNSKLSFERHVNEKIMKAKKGIGIIKYLSEFLPIKTLDQMYKALVRSHLDYCDTIYHIPALNSQINLGVTLNSLMEKVESTQYQAALAITGTWQGTNRYKLYEELGWESLSDRRWCRRILQVHKIEKYITPSYLRDKLPSYRRHLYRFNNSNTFQKIRCKTCRYQNSFFPDHAFFVYYENAVLVYDVMRMRQLSKQTLHELSPNDNS